MIDMMLAVHIISGAIGLLAGFAVLTLKKATPLHTRIGKVFFYTMLLLGTTGAVAGFARWIPLSALNGLMICYFIITSRLAFRVHLSMTVLVERFMLFFAVGLTMAYILFGLHARTLAGGELGGFSGTSYFVFGSVAGVAAIADLRHILVKNYTLRARVLRHLLRMLFPLFMATAAFFLGQARLFPVALQQSFIIALPVIIVISAMAFWAFRVFFGSTWRTRNS